MLLIDVESISRWKVKRVDTDKIYNYRFECMWIYWENLLMLGIETNKIGIESNKKNSNDQHGIYDHAKIVTSK